MRKIEKYERLPAGADRRVKLTPEDKQIILERWENPLDNVSQRTLAKDFGVSRRTIQFIVDPAKHEANVALRRERIAARGSYYDRAANTAAMREHRAYKKQLKESQTDV